MQATVPGQNRTGAAVSPKEVDLMLKAVDELSPLRPINTLQMDVERQTYIADADSIGSISPTQASGKIRSKKSGPQAQNLNVFLDKLGERIAFERTGTRLYTALITKYLASVNAGLDALPPAELDSEEPAAGSTRAQETPGETLDRIRAEELGHFHLLCDCVASLGGDPTSQTPCADVTAAASIGLMQVVTDPRTTLAQCLNAMMTAELTDNAGWELLAQLAQDAGQEEMARTFLQALETEQQHLEIIRTWLQALLITEAGTPAV
jgi:hypothetical protein